MKENVDVKEATHVKTASGKYEKIASKWGIDPNGRQTVRRRFWRGDRERPKDRHVDRARVREGR